MKLTLVRAPIVIGSLIAVVISVAIFVSNFSFL
jgi:hypothetical protein